MSRRRTGRRLDAMSVVGLALGLGLVAAAQVLEGGHLGSILQSTAALIVFGGTLGAVLVSFSLTDVQEAARSLRDVFLEPPGTSHATIASLVAFATKARREGIMSLEDQVEQVGDPFLKRGLSLAVDGASPTTLRAMLEAEAVAREEHDEVPARVFEAAGGYAPTLGILGAVLGLIHVMESLADPTRLGAGIAVAFVATVYGVGSANLIFLPIAAKLRRRTEAAARQREIALEGILAIQEGMNPRLIEHKLRGLLATDTGARGARTLRRAA